MKERERERRPQPPFSPSVASLCHPWFTTTNFSYSFPFFETSATALRGTTGNYNGTQIIVIIIMIMILLMLKNNITIAGRISVVIIFICPLLLILVLPVLLILPPPRPAALAAPIPFLWHSRLTTLTFRSPLLAVKLNKRCMAALHRFLWLWMMCTGTTLQVKVESVTNLTLTHLSSLSGLLR